MAALTGAIICGGVGWLIDVDPVARGLLMVFAFALAGCSIAGWIEEIFIAHESSRFALRQHLIFRPLEIGIALVVLVAGGDVMAVALTHGLVWWAQAATGYFLVRHRTVSFVPRWNWREWLPLLRSGLPIGLAGVFTAWLLHGH